MKISVVIPLFNKEATVLRAVNSVLLQTRLPEEIIVVNDGSTDCSEQIVTSLNHPLVKVVNQPNAGVSAARNRGISEAKEDWIAFLDADDEWLPDFLKTISELALRYNKAKVYATAYYLQDHRGNKRKVILRRLHIIGNGILDNYFEVATSSEPPINSSSVVIYKHSLELIGGFPEGIMAGEDMLSWTKLAVTNMIAYSTEPLSIFIQDAAHTYQEKPIRIPQEPDIVGRELVLIAKRNHNEPWLQAYVGHWYKMRASIFLRLGMKRKSIHEIRKALSINLFNLHLWLYLVLLIFPTAVTNTIFRRFKSA